MYKRRLTKWTMRKNCHLTDLQRLARLERHGSTPRESPLGTSDSSGPSRTRLLRYARRKGLAFPQDAQRAVVRGKPSRPIKGRDEISCMEHLCWVLHGYLDADATAHPPALDAWRQSTCNTKVLAIFTHISPAMQHFFAGRYQEGARHLSHFYDGARSIIEAYPLLLTRDVLAMTVYGHSAAPEIMCQVLRYFRDLSSIVYGPTHPLSVLLSWITANCAPGSESSASPALLIEILRDYCLRMVGPDHYDTADCEILLTVWQRNPISPLQALLQHYDATYGLGSYQSLHSLGNILSVVVSQRDWSALRTVLTDLSRRPPHLSAAGGRRLAYYVQTCRDTLDAYDHHDHADWRGEGAIATMMQSEIKSIGMGHYMTLAADEWKMPSR